MHFVWQITNIRHDLCVLQCTCACCRCQDEGFMEGQADGRRKGLLEGYHLGCQKGCEVGAEVSFSRYWGAGRNTALYEYTTHRNCTYKCLSILSVQKCVFEYIHTHAHMCTWTHTLKHTCTQAHTHTHTLTHTHAHTHTHRGTYTYTHSHSSSHI